MSHWNEFNYVVVNDDFDRAVDDLVHIVEGRGHALDAHRPELGPLLKELVGR
jgi:guanylate kinase